MVIPAQVVNISWDQISTDSITIWWNINEDNLSFYPPVLYYVISVLNDNNITYSNSINIHRNHEVDPCYVTIIPINIVGYGPSATVNVGIIPTMTSSSVVPTSSVTVSSTIDEQSSSFISTTGTSTSTTSMNTPVSSSTTVSTTTTGSNAVPIISGAIGTVFVIIIIIILVLVILTIKKQRSNTDAVAIPTYDEIIVKPTTTTAGVPIYDTPMELQANTAYDRPFSFLLLMATATGIYWCLVLTGYISLVVSAYEQSPSTVCPGDELVFTCATVNGGTVRWRLNENDGQFVLLAGSSPPTTLGSFSLKVTQYNAPNTIVSTATNNSAPVSLNGTSIDCAEGLTGPFHRNFINYP
uniref:Fibronectin type-III domain-containing protein n=4 Tax=Amphimedon queenslandica TaxID=400682 RepID=A0A1X7T5P0_AMPQE